MDVYDLAGPFALIGAAALGVFALVVPARFQAFKRPYAIAWAISSLFLGSSIFIDQTAMQHAPPGEALAWALGVAAGLAVLVPLIWLRVHLWDHLSAAQRRRQDEELAARYRAKDFSE